MDKDLEELEHSVIDRAKFWDGYIGMLINVREGGLYMAEKMDAWKSAHLEEILRAGLQQAIDAATEIQRLELAACFMLGGIGGSRAEKYARDRARAILGKTAIEFASAMEWAPTYWHTRSKHDNGLGDENGASHG
jgi:hypothetical protein